MAVVTGTFTLSDPGKIYVHGIKSNVAHLTYSVEHEFPTAGANYLISNIATSFVVGGVINTKQVYDLLPDGGSVNFNMKNGTYVQFTKSGTTLHTGYFDSNNNAIPNIQTHYLLIGTDEENYYSWARATDANTGNEYYCILLLDRSHNATVFTYFLYPNYSNKENSKCPHFS